MCSFEMINEIDTISTSLHHWRGFAIRAARIIKLSQLQIDYLLSIVLRISKEGTVQVCQ